MPIRGPDPTPIDRSRAEPSMRILIGGLVDGKSQNEMASELKSDRFEVARMFKSLQNQFAHAA